MNPLARLGDYALKSAYKSLPFSRQGSNGWGNGGGYFMSDMGFTLGDRPPGSKYDYNQAAGVLWQNAAVAACFGALTKAFADAPPILERRKGKEWELVEDAPIINLINKPNNAYSGERLLGLTLVGVLAHGSGFWRVEDARNGQPGEIWYEPPVGVGPTGMAPLWDTTAFIKDYAYYLDGRMWDEHIKKDHAVYFRCMLNPTNPRYPYSPLSLCAREIATLNGAATYTGALLRNSAVPSGVLGLEGAGNVGGQLPTPEQAEEMKRKLREGFRGDNVGEPFVSSLPWKWNPFNWSPAELNIDGLRQWPQGNVCAVLGTPELVAGLPTGQQPTYANLEATMRWWWDNTVMPLESSFADEIETQLFPIFDLDPADFRIGWDRSKIPCLQEDEEEKHATVREDYKAGIIDLHTATIKMGGEATDDMKGVRHPLATPKDPNAEPDPIPTPADIQNANRLDAARGRKSLKLVDANGMHHDDTGKFSGSDGSGLAPHQKATFDHLTANLPDTDENKNYRLSLVDALSHMPEGAAQRIARNVTKTEFHPTVELLSSRLSDPSFPIEYQGAYDWSTGELFLNDKDLPRVERKELYAHELSHAIDGINKGLSSTAEWQAVWRQEMKDGQLLPNSAKSPEEGFADFGATLYSDASLADHQKAFPLSYAFWNKRGLI